jgi:hypothetical protein
LDGQVRSGIDADVVRIRARWLMTSQTWARARRHSLYGPDVLEPFAKSTATFGATYGRRTLVDREVVHRQAETRHFRGWLPRRIEQLGACLVGGELTASLSPMRLVRISASAC